MSNISPYICNYFAAVSKLSKNYRQNKVQEIVEKMTQSTECNISAVVQDMINSDKVVIFSKTYCPHCDEVKKICGTLQKPYTCYELDTLDEGDTIQSTLEDITGVRTVPRIFVEGKCLGGASDFQSLYDTGDIYNILNIKKSNWFVNLKNRIWQFFATRSN